MATKKEPEQPKQRVWKVTLNYSVWRFTIMTEAVEKAKQLLDVYPSGVTFELVMG
jgi:hypothetical protein